MSGKSERRAARSVVADYHQAELGDLVAHVGEAVDRYRAGELDAFEVDQVLFQYSLPHPAMVYLISAEPDASYSDHRSPS